MIDSSPTFSVPSGSEGSSLFDGISWPDDAFCEAFETPGVPREEWQPIIRALDALKPEALRKRQDRVRRMRHEDGATFNPFDDPNGPGTPWALETVPWPLTSGEWAILETGLIQRAMLMEMILADIYGPQNLVREGRIPAELIFANPQFLRPCHGIQPPGNRFLTFYAVDLVRGRDGRFRVLRDYGANPAGLGYALENRIVISRVFAGLYHQTQIRRLAPFFQTFHRSLIQRAAILREDPDIVLLSPGPDSRIYFEHALLSRYLGYPLVESQDLTVRNGEVFLKKLAGLEPLDAVFRHIDDLRIDPFALRKDTGTGVAGLIQAARDGNVDIVNPIGSGFVDTPMLSVFLPALSRYMMGAELLLENHPAWWCGTADSRGHVLANLEGLTVGPSLDRSEAAPAPDEVMAAIQSAPHAFMARGPVEPSMVPAWNLGGSNCRYALLRVFACATDQGFSVMPGGLAITAPDVATLIEVCPKQQQSKDVWVLSDQPVEPFSLMDGLQKTAELRRGSDLPSRVADNLLWLGRYLERSEGLVRILRSVYRRLSGEAGLGDIPELSYLLNILRAENAIPPESGQGPHMPRFRELYANLNNALYQKDKPESMVSLLGRVQETARNVRDRLSLDSWRVINRLEGFAETRANDPLELLDDTLFTLSAFSGLAMESMTRGLGWRFMDMGRRVERAIHQTNLIRRGLSRVWYESRSDLEALLEVSDSIMTYRARYRTAFQLAPVLDLLLVDESNPKSLAFQCGQLAAHVEHLPRQSDRRYSTAEERIALEMLTTVRLLDLTGLDRDPGNQNNGRLANFLEFMENRLLDFAQQVSAHYLARVPTVPHYSMILGDPEP